MASKRNKRRRQCLGKIAHSLESAEKHRYGLRIKGDMSGINIYKCQFCKKYHIGHNVKGNNLLVDS